MLNIQHTCGKRVGEANYIKYGRAKNGNNGIDDTPINRTGIEKCGLFQNLYIWSVD